MTDSLNTDAWKLECTVLETTTVNGTHIADTLRSFQECWNFDELVAVTDNASNEVKPFKLLDWRSIILMVRKGLSGIEINRLVGKRRSLASFFHHRSQAMDVFLEKQKLLLDEAFQGHKLIIDCPAWWNRTYEMMVRLSEQMMPALRAVATDKSGKYLDLRMELYTFEEQVIEFTMMLLKPFNMAAKILTVEKKPTVSLLSPIAIQLDRPTMFLTIRFHSPKRKSVMLENIKDKAHSRVTAALSHGISLWLMQKAAQFPHSSAASCCMDKRSACLWGGTPQFQFQFPVLLLKQSSWI